MHDSFRWLVLPVALIALCLDCPAANAQSPVVGDRPNPPALAPREPWTSSRLVGTPDPPSPYTIERAFGELAFKMPVDLASAPGSDRLFVVEQEGKIYSFADDADRTPSADLVFDLRAEVEGARMAYGLTFDPEFAENRFCYLCYVLADDLPEGSRVSRFTVKDETPPRLDPHSEQLLLTFRSGGHNGGCLKFGPDGYLYISTGDAAPPFPPDPLRTGQNIGDLLSSILRIDVKHSTPAKPYSVPADNPFVDSPGARPEVWAYGFRNPWKMSFDPSGGLWVGDVGWELLEMVYRVERGGNYGWAVMEGSQPVLAETDRGPTPILPPTIEHPHTEARSITGGYVYQGRRLPDLAATYIYGDYETGKVWGLRYEDRRLTWHQELVDTAIKIVSFGIDRHDELYLLDHGGGLYRLAPNPNQAANEQFPRRLSKTGLFRSLDPLVPAGGVVAYRVAAEPWADGAVAERYVALPDRSQVDTAGGWRFPPGAVLAKTISMPLERGDPASLRRLETQVLHYDGLDWRGYTYVWNEQQTDAELADDDGFDITLTLRDPQAPGGERKLPWRFFSRAQCVVCHNTMAGSVLGFTPVQLNTARADLGADCQQLDALATLGVLSARPSGDLPGPADPSDTSADLNRRARSYVHANCAHCHRRHGGGTAAIELPFELPLAETRALDARPTQGAFGIPRAAVIAPGDPLRSILFYRMAKLGRGHMPQLGSSVIDEEGLRLIHDWIEQLKSGGETDGEETRQLAELRASEGSDREAALLDRLFSTTRGALALMWAIEAGTLSKTQRSRAAMAGVRHADGQISGLFERFVPDELRPRRLGDAIQPAAILSLTGEAARGRRLFFETAAIQCKQCHRIGNQGTELGPDLSEIGKKYNRAQLLESIIEPSKQIDPKFAAYLVETTAGQVHAGLLIEKTEREVILKDTQNKQIRIPADEIELFAPQQKSLMPDSLLRDMTAQEVADLVEFLGTLK